MNINANIAIVNIRILMIKAFQKSFLSYLYVPKYASKGKTRLRHLEKLNVAMNITAPHNWMTVVSNNLFFMICFIVREFLFFTDSFKYKIKSTHYMTSLVGKISDYFINVKVKGTCIDVITIPETTPQVILVEVRSKFIRQISYGANHPAELPPDINQYKGRAVEMILGPESYYTATEEPSLLSDGKTHYFKILDITTR